MDDKNHYNNHQRQQQRPSPYTYLHSNTFQGQTTPVAGPSSRRESPQQPNYLWQQSEDYEERERDQQEYISFVNQRRPYSRTSDTASIQFLNDDRLRQNERSGRRTADSIGIAGVGGSQRQLERDEPKELFAEDVAQIRVTEQVNNNGRRPMSTTSGGGGRRREGGGGERREEGQQSEVDYSSSDFQHARAAIEEAAARQQNFRGPPDRLRRVRRIGDTTVITEHRDPYSFYWQLDQLKNAEQEPARLPPPVDYVLEEEEEEEHWITEEEERQPPGPPQFLSPDSGVHFVPRGEHGEELEVEEEQQGPVYSPIRISEDPSAFSHYWHPIPSPIQEKPQIPSPPIISTTDTAQQTTIQEEPVRQPIIEEHAFRQTTTKKRVDLAEEEEFKDKEAIDYPSSQFNVRYLGHLELKESELEGVETSQASLNNAITRLRNEVGKEAILAILPDGVEVQKKNGEIKDGGGERELEFAFVALDKGRLLCHVFRCDQPASAVAEALGNICNTLIRQRSQPRPSSLNGGLRRITRQSTPILPSPIEEQKKIIRCHFIGVTQVPRATGIEMLNEAVDRLLKEVRKERWTLVDVHISPSVIAIFEAKGVKRQIASCRVRYLSFLGIGRDTKHCAFIVAQSADHFICYVFHTEPSANSLAKTIEAACKLRYQKVLDAHLTSPNDPLSRSMPTLDEWNQTQRGTRF
uniref:PID domain-containing protein n=1 Tax=Meloidogyne incognita TaxID=6306 RepID=A0A914N1A6_MELIC